MSSAGKNKLYVSGRRFVQPFRFESLKQITFGFLFLSLLLPGCATNQSPTISRDGFVFKLPQGWKVDEIESGEGEILFERKHDNEDTGLAGVAIKKITTNESRDSLLKTEDALFMKSTTMNTVAFEKTINQFAGIKGLGIKKSGAHKDDDGSIPIEYLLFAPDSDSQLPKCFIFAFRACDRKWGTMKDIDYIVQNAHSDDK